MLDPMMKEAAKLFDSVEVEDTISGDTTELVEILDAVGVTTNVKNISEAFTAMNHTSELLNKSEFLNLCRHVQPISDDKDSSSTRAPSSSPESNRLVSKRSRSPSAIERTLEDTGFSKDQSEDCSSQTKRTKVLPENKTSECVSFGFDEWTFRPQISVDNFEGESRAKAESLYCQVTRSMVSNIEETVELEYSKYAYNHKTN